ncbi:MAG: cobalamin B12-binding domain-containing protein [Pseudomonadota bacterium]
MSYTGFLSDAIDSLAMRPRAPSPYASQLLDVLSREVIPKLSSERELFPHSATETLQTLMATLESSHPQVVLTLTQLLLSQRTTDARAFVAVQEQIPLPEATINLEILAPAARLLGLLWERDLCDFNQVTFGVMQLQHIMRDLSRHANDMEHHSGHHHRIFLAPAEGEDHTFGLCMLGDFLIRAGWDVAGGTGQDRQATLTALAEQFFDIAGFTISDHRWLAGLRDTIREARARSANPELIILVGGPLLQKLPALAHDVGADASAVDAPATLRLAADLVAKQAMSRRV